MAFQSVFFDTKLSDFLCDEVVKEFSSLELQESKIFNSLLDESVRKSNQTQINSSHWVSGYLWHYINFANNTNFFYDLTGFDSDNIQYAEYSSGGHYLWHTDHGIAKSLRVYTTGQSNQDSNTINANYVNQRICMEHEVCRKLSITLQLSDEDEYEGGELQFLDDADKIYTSSKKKGTVIVFDSRTKHRVRKVKSGVRKSLVGWAIGPRWK